MVSDVCCSATSFMEVYDSCISTVTQVESYGQLPETGQVGDICIVGNDPYMYTGDDCSWVLVGSVWEPSREPETPKAPERTNCKNCGAPLIGGRCHYCGTTYW